MVENQGGLPIRLLFTKLYGRTPKPNDEKVDDGKPKNRDELRETLSEAHQAEKGEPK